MLKLLIFCIVLTNICQLFAQDNCQTILTNIRLTKDEYNEFGHLQRTCNDEITVNKCEGVCISQTRPSIYSVNGFQNKCFCCTETELRERRITLNNCYNEQGSQLTHNDMKSITTLIQEPTDCYCYQCND